MNSKQEILDDGQRLYWDFQSAYDLKLADEQSLAKMAKEFAEGDSRKKESEFRHMQAYGGFTLAATYRDYAVAELAAKEHYEDHRGLYQDQALREAREAGKFMRGWEVEKTVPLGYMSKLELLELGAAHPDFARGHIAQRLWGALYRTFGLYHNVVPGSRFERGETTELFNPDVDGSEALNLDGLEKLLYSEAFEPIPDLGVKAGDLAKYIIGHREAQLTATAELNREL